MQTWGPDCQCGHQAASLLSDPWTNPERLTMLLIIADSHLRMIRTASNPYKQTSAHREQGKHPRRSWSCQNRGKPSYYAHSAKSSSPSIRLKSASFGTLRVSFLQLEQIVSKNVRGAISQLEKSKQLELAREQVEEFPENPRTDLWNCHDLNETAEFIPAERKASWSLQACPASRANGLHQISLRANLSCIENSKS